MKKISCSLKRVLITVLIIGVGLIIAPKFAEANFSTILPSGMVVGDDQGIKVKSNGKYLVDIRDVQPGKSWSTKITMINIEKDVPYHLTMHVSPPTLIEGSLDLSKAIQMTLTYDGKKVYEGPVSGVSSSVNLQKVQSPLDLGLFKAGDSRMLEATFELDGEKYTNKDFLKKNIMENIWYFKAVKTKAPDPTDPGTTTPKKNLLRLPETGEEWRSTLMFFCIGLFLCLVGLLIIKYRWTEKKKKQETQSEK